MSETIYYLEMTAEEDLRPSRSQPPEHFEIKRQERPDARLSRSLYERVGNGWNWVDRLEWTDEQWIEYLSKPGTETWVLRAEDEAAGYFELAKTGDAVEIVAFGLLPDFLGRGLGGYLLTEAARRAFQTGASRVWLHTSSRDHPQALKNYEARGFRVFKTERL